MRKLTAKEERFIHEFLVDGNGTQAAIRAGYSAACANRMAYKLMQREAVKLRLAAVSKKALEKIDVKVDDILRELVRIADFDWIRACDSKGKLLPPHLMPEDIRRAIASIEVGSRGKLKVKFHSKISALELLGKYRKLFTDRVEFEGKLSLAESMQKARERVRKQRGDEQA